MTDVTYGGGVANTAPEGWTPPLKNLDFGQAIYFLKQGKKVKRAIWGGYWFLSKNATFSENLEDNYVRGFSFNNGLIVAVLKDMGGCAAAQPYQADILAEDWEIVD